MAAHPTAGGVAPLYRAKMDYKGASNQATYCHVAGVGAPHFAQSLGDSQQRPCKFPAESTADVS